MKPSDDSDAGKGGQFMTTRWSSIMLSAQSQAPGSDNAREEFCQLYRYRLYAFIRRRGYNADNAEDRYSREPTDVLTPEKIFDANWTVTLLAQAIERLKEEYSAQGKGTIFETLRPFLDLSGAAQALSYEVVLEKLKIGSAGTKTPIHRSRKRYSELLPEAVAQAVSDPSEIDDEIRSLCEALISSEGRFRP